MTDFKRHQCLGCEHIYDETLGDPDNGVVSGTRWEDLPEDWDCPICGVTKECFKLIG